MTDTHLRPPSPLPRLLLSGIDSLYVAYFHDAANSSLDWDDLRFRKEQLKSARRARVEPVTLGTETFALQPYGKHPYPIVLRNKAFEVRLAERMQPTVYVQFTSESLWTLGLEALAVRFHVWAESVGLTAIRPEQVSRADFAFDFAIAKPDFLIDHFIAREIKDTAWRERRRTQTIQIGTGDVVLRVYDKVAEVEQASAKVWFFQLWGQSSGVWRVEFQVRVKRLGTAGIRTLDDLAALQADLLRELAGQMTLRAPGADSNRSRWPLHPLWRALQAAIADRPQTGLVAQLNPPALLDWRLERSLRSLYGSLKGIGALVSLRNGLPQPETLSEVLEALEEHLVPHHSPTLWRADLADRMTRYELGQW